MTVVEQSWQPDRRWDAERRSTGYACIPTGNRIANQIVSKEKVSATGEGKRKKMNISLRGTGEEQRKKGERKRLLGQDINYRGLRTCLVHGQSRLIPRITCGFTSSARHDLCMQSQKARPEHRWECVSQPPQIQALKVEKNVKVYPLL